MTFLDFFAGIGGFRRGMELAGHKCLGFCEFDKYATASYTSMHLCNDDDRKYLATLPLRQRQKEILDEKYRHGEWYSADIRGVACGSLPRADCWCFGFPCQDISVAGKQRGFDGERSSLFFEVMRLLKGTGGGDRPQWLLIEIVKNLLAVSAGFDFARVLCELEDLGYVVEWRLLNSKDFGVPQNRERLYIVGFHGDRFPGDPLDFPGNSRETDVRLKQLNNAKSMALRIFDPSGIACCLLANGGAWARAGLYKVGDRVRELTPREAFRIQGWTDEYFERAMLVNFKSQLYKQAGNGVTVNVVKAIGERLNDLDTCDNQRAAGLSECDLESL